MAKKEEKTVETPVVNAENVMEVINKGNLAEVSLGEEVEAEIQKEKDERKKREIKSRYLRADYSIKKSLVDLRHTKRLMEISKYEMAQVGRIARLLKGFTVDETTLQYAKAFEDDILKKEVVDAKAGTITIGETTYKSGDKVPGQIDIVDYDKAIVKIGDILRNKRHEENKLHGEELNKLDAAYGEYWSRDWRYCW